MENFSVNIDFVVIKTEDPKIIMVGDKSNWGVAENLPAYIKLLPPGSINWITTNFAKNKINIFNSINLGLSCLVDDCGEETFQDLDDGIWEICLQSSFQGLEKKLYFLKDDVLRLDLDKLYIEQSLDYDSAYDIIKSLEKAEFFLSVAHAAVKKGDHVKAKKAYIEARKEVDKYINCKDCF